MSGNLGRERADMEKLLVRRVERRARRMHDLMDRVGVDSAVLVRVKGGDAYLEARRRCLFCGTSDKCLRWLDQTQPTDVRPAFCPNLSLFEACKSPPSVHSTARKFWE
jgi:Family of unknown function (DUF6455)